MKIITITSKLKIHCLIRSSWAQRPRWSGILTTQLHLWQSWSESKVTLYLCISNETQVHQNSETLTALLYVDNTPNTVYVSSTPNKSGFSRDGALILCKSITDGKQLMRTKKLISPSLNMQEEDLEKWKSCKRNRVNPMLSFETVLLLKVSFFF